MKTHLDKKQGSGQRTSDTQLQRNNSQPTFQFIDNRPEALLQRKLQQGANNSPQSQQAAQFQSMADNHAAQQFTIQKKENKTGLPDNLKSGIENLSGYSMDDVKVHYNSSKPAQLQAHAYAQGTDIHLGAGQEKHLPHEAWHVVQQKQGRVKPTMQMKGGVNVNDDKGLEREADVMGRRAEQMVTTNQQKSEPNFINQKIMSNTFKKRETSVFQRVFSPGEKPPELDDLLKGRLNSRMGALSGINLKRNIIEEFYKEIDDCRDTVSDLTLKWTLHDIKIYIQDTLVDNMGLLEMPLNEFKDMVLSIALEGRIIPRYLHNEDLLLKSGKISLKNEYGMHFIKDIQNLLKDIFKKLIEKEIKNATSANKNENFDELSEKDRINLIADLKKMPVVINILSGQINAQPLNGGWNTPSINDNTNKAYSYDKTKLHNNIDISYNQISNIIEPSLLNNLIKPGIQINDKKITKFDLEKIENKVPISGEYRANELNNRVNLARNSSNRTITHELGHAIEDQLPIDSWLAIHRLLRMRHDKAVEKNKMENVLLPLYPLNQVEGAVNEVSLQSKMPVTGSYSAKVYGSGSTEVMSMTMEYFSNPSNAKKMIETDPLQSAVILKALNPTEFNAAVRDDLKSKMPNTIKS